MSEVYSKKLNTEYHRGIVMPTMTIIAIIMIVKLKMMSMIIMVIRTMKKIDYDADV